ncbi:hypothetical protein MO867_16665 [Microbulbifer sp. OS29]|uniref:Lipoprotein n=1 Tax=Microbulbifer okhotskensis TaxID=2926617 RepID=A0A9X2J680_9GAMM|nr:hypothetical protein [Microbulbifer okhotskensis]MCO1335968.1 hypothetical protein [Microbulbifer okhotskensis]
MRIFKGFLKVGASLVALSGCQDAMKGSEIYPTIDNLVEIEASRLKIMEVRSINNSVQIIVGESPDRLCEISVANASLENKLSLNSIESKDKIKAECLWDGLKYIQAREHHTAIAINIDKASTIDLQLINKNKNRYLAFTVVNKKLKENQI